MKSRSQSLALFVIMILAVPFGLAGVTLFRQTAEPVSAQQGDNGELDESIAYAEMIKDQDLSDIVILPAGAREIGSQSDGSGIEVIPIGAFRHTGNTANSWSHFPLNGYIRNISTLTTCFSAPTYPPDGATLTAFRATLRDDDAASDIAVTLYRVSNTNNVVNGAEILATAVNVSRDNSDVFEVEDPSIASGKETVSKNYNYYAYTCLSDIPDPDDALLLLYGASVVYTP